MVALFGRARLVRTLDGRYHLKGGTAEDQQQAEEWISMFIQEADTAVGPCPIVTVVLACTGRDKTGMVKPESGSRDRLQGGASPMACQQQCQL
jgi:hypothetical protein